MWVRQCLRSGQVRGSHPIAGFQLAVDPVEGRGQLGLCLLVLGSRLVAGDQLKGMGAYQGHPDGSREPSPLSQPAMGSSAYHSVKVQGFLEGSAQPVQD